LERLLTDSVVFAESPRWHHDRLWFSDVHDYALKTVDLDGSVHVVAPVPGRPAGLGVLPDGRMLMATANERMLYSVSAAGEMSAVADLSASATGLLNDMVVDATGRAYVGDTGFRPAQGESFRPGRTWLVAPGADPEVAAEDMHFPNGCAISDDGRTLYVAETFGNRISRFAIDGDGRLSDREIHVEFPEAPDGLCLDADGALWVGMIRSGEYLRIDSAGSVVQRLPSAYPFAVTCVLGGPERRLLFLCSADTTMERLSKGDSRGRIDAVEVPTGGAGLP
jgi:sugar lactone lactonase YvrE